MIASLSNGTHAFHIVKVHSFDGDDDDNDDGDDDNDNDNDNDDDGDDDGDDDDDNVKRYKILPSFSVALIPALDQQLALLSPPCGFITIMIMMMMMMTTP